MWKQLSGVKRCVYNILHSEGQTCKSNYKTHLYLMEGDYKWPKKEHQVEHNSQKKQKKNTVNLIKLVFTSYPQGVTIT